MKLIKVIKRITAFVFIALILTVSGAFASWQFSEKSPESVTALIKPSVFPWEGSEILPDDVEGEHHKILIDTVINGVVVDENGNEINIGLNNPDSYLSKEIENRSSSWLFSSDTLGSMDFWERSDIEKYFGLDTNNLTFLIYFPDGDGKTYYLYTTSVILGAENSPNFPIGTAIYPIYRTTLVKNREGIYEATITEEGYANSAYYTNPITGSIFVKYPSFDPSSWKVGEKGDRRNNAVYSYVGQTQTVVFPESGMRWYSVTNVNGKKLKVSVTTVGSTVEIYNANGNSNIAIDGGEQNSPGVIFTANGNTYYILVKGEQSTSLTIEQV